MELISLWINTCLVFLTVLLPQEEEVGAVVPKVGGSAPGEWNSLGGSKRQGGSRGVLKVQIAIRLLKSWDQVNQPFLFNQTK